MGATSISVRHVEKFEIPEGKTNIEPILQLALYQQQEKP